MMVSKRHTPEQIINKLRQAEVEIANGATIAQVCKKIGVTDQTQYQGQESISLPRKSHLEGVYRAGEQEDRA